MQLLVILGQPMSEPLENRMTLFNEVMVSVNLYLMLLLTDYVGE